MFQDRGDQAKQYAAASLDAQSIANAVSAHINKKTVTTREVLPRRKAAISADVSAKIAGLGKSCRLLFEFGKNSLGKFFLQTSRQLLLTILNVFRHADCQLSVGAKRPQCKTLKVRTRMEA
ncbi:MAG: hypothetical protein ACLQUZ_00665 [Rhizomicrobium sp.]